MVATFILHIPYGVILVSCDQIKSDNKSDTRPRREVLLRR